MKTRARNRAAPNRAASSRIVLLSDDAHLHAELLRVGENLGYTVTGVGSADEAFEHLDKLAADLVLLDLDLPGESGWRAAESLLQRTGAPPVLLLTGRTEQFDLRTAVSAGSLTDKTEDVSRLFELIEEAAGLSEGEQRERNGMQRALIRWIRPSNWTIPSSTSFRFWGINE